MKRKYFNLLIVLCVLLSMLGPVQPALAADPPGTQAWADFGTSYNYAISGNSFTSQPVTGWKGWAANVKTGGNFSSLSVNLSSSIPFDWMSPTPVTSALPDYGWSFSGVQGANIMVSSGTSSVNFTPGFDITRSINPPSLTADGNQVLTIMVTPKVAMDALDIDVNVKENSMLIPTFVANSTSIDPDPGASISFSPDGRDLNVQIVNPVVSQMYTCNVTITVNLKDGVSSAEYMPLVGITESSSIANGTVNGTGVGRTISGMGNWTVNTTGDYNWNWNEFSGKTVHLDGSKPNDVWTGFSNSYDYSAEGDNFTNHQVSGHESWGINTNAAKGFTALAVNLTSGVPFDYFNPPPDISSPPDYSWFFGDVPGIDMHVDSQNNTVNFTPGFDLTRSINPITVEADGNQTLTLAITPREAAGGLGVGVNVNENMLVIPTITGASVSPDPGADINLSPDGNDLKIQLKNPAVNQTYTCTITIHVDLKDGVSSAEHMPRVMAGLATSVDSGSSFGSGIMHSMTDMGDWTINATGNYVWNWGEILNKGISLSGTSDGNNPWVDFHAAYNCSIPGDNFTSHQVAGSKGCGVHVNSGTSFPLLTVNLSSSVPFDQMNPSPAFSAPPYYEWSFTDVPGTDINVDSSTTSVNFTPDFNVIRSVSQLTFPASANQTTTLNITPLVPMEGLGINMGVSEDSLMNPTIISVVFTPNPGADINISPDGKNFNANINNPTVNQTFTCTITIQVQLKPGVTNINYVPGVNISQGNNTAGGMVNGNQVTHNLLELGTWSVNTTGNYTWNWGEFLNKSVFLQGTGGDTGNNTGVDFSSGYSYNVAGDNFTSHQVTGSKNWGVHVNSGNSFPVLTVNLSSSVPFDHMNPNPTVLSPPYYEWGFTDVPGTDINVGSSTASVNFTPDFNVTRNVSQQTFTTSANQTMTLNITPLSPMEGLGINMGVSEDSLMNPTIISVVFTPNPGADINISPDGKNFNANINNPTVNQTFTCTITIQVQLKPGVTNINYVPGVNINQSNNTTGGMVTGSQVTHNLPELGTWSVNTTGNYTWNWSEHQNMSVSLQGASNGSGNNANVGFGTNYNFNVSGDNFTSHQVYGWKDWGIHVDSEMNFPSLTVNLSSSVPFDQMNPGPIVSAPPYYEWDFGNVQGVNVDVGSSVFTVNFTPDFNVTRSVSQQIFTTSANQTMTLNITPLSPMEGLDINMGVNEDSFMVPTIIGVILSPNPGANINISPDGRSLKVNIQNPTVNQTYTYTITIQVLLKPGVPLVDYVPWVNINQSNNSAGGMLTGSEVTHNLPELGTWSVNTSGNYTWNWGEFLNKSIALHGTSNGSDNNTWVGFNTGYNTGVPGDNFTSHQVAGSKGWGVHVNSGTSFPLLTVNLSSSVPFDQMNPSPAVSAPPYYEWGFTDVPGTDINVGSSTTSVNFTPDFNVIRSVSQQTFTTSANQTTTLNITPLVPMEGLGINMGVSEDSLMNPTIISVVFTPNPGADINISPDGKNFNANINNPTVNQTFTCTITVQVQLKPGVTNINYVPGVNISQGNNTADGMVTGNQIAYSVSGLGTWSVNTTGNFTWNWNEVMRKTVSLQGMEESTGPDLTISEKHETWLVEGKVYTVQYTVKNIGQATVGPGHSVLLAVDGQQREKKQVPVSLAPGQEYTDNFSSAIILTDGWDMVQVIADASNNVPESNEGNNALLNVFSWPAKPDLAVSKWEEWVTENQSYIVHYTVRNQGNAQVGQSCNVTLEVDGVIVDTQTVTNLLGPGDQISGAFAERSLTGDGIDHITVCVDNTNTVDESIEDNNCQTNTLAVPAAPDLTILIKKEKWVPGQEGSQYTVTFFVRNQGNAPAPAGSDVSIRVDGTEVQQITIPYDLQPGQVFVGVSNAVTLSDTQDDIVVTADCNGEIPESDETNNDLMNTWALPSPTEGPDLMVAKSENWTNEATGAYQLNVHVQNVGSQTLTGGVAVDVYIDRVLQGSMHTEHTGDLAVDSFFDVFFDIDLTDTTDEIIVTATPMIPVQEITENNNTVINTWGYPDLVVSKAYEEWVNPDNHSEGYKVYFTVKNIGAGTACNGTDVGETINGVPIAAGDQVALPASLNPGETWSGFFDIIVPEPTGGQTDTIIVTADVNHECVESDEDNNSIQTLWPPSMTYIGMNIRTLDSPYNDPRVRQAVFLALDRNTITAAFNGTTVQSIVSPAVPNPAISNLNYDPNKAKDLLIESGYPNGFATALYTTPVYINLSTTVKDLLASIGIDATITILDPSALVSQLESGAFGLYVTAEPVAGWSQTPQVLGNLLLSDGSANYTGYNSNTFDIRFDGGVFTDAESCAFSKVSGLTIVPLYWSSSPPPQPDGAPDLIVSEAHEEWVNPDNHSEGYKVYFTVKNIGAGVTCSGTDVGGTINGVPITAENQVALPVSLNPGETWSGFFDVIIPEPSGGQNDIIIVTADVNKECVETNEANNSKLTFWPPYMTYVGMNIRTPSSPFYNPEVRQAVFMALNRDGLAEAFFGSKVLSIVTPSAPNPAINNLNYDPNKAKDLLIESGYPNGFATALYTTPVYIDLALAVKNMLASFRIDAEITVLDPAAFISQLQTGVFGLYMTAEPVADWSQTPQILGNLLLSDGSANYTGYTNSTFDSQFNGGSYTDAENTAFSIADGIPIVPLYWSSNPPGQVSDYPDLTFSATHVDWVNPDNHSEGYKVYFTVKNTGTGVANSGIGEGLVGIDVGLTINGEPLAAGTQVTLPGALNPGETWSGFFDVILPEPTGGQNDQIIVTVDVNHECIESNENNNTALGFWPFYTMTYLGMNVDTVLFTNVKVRQAVYLAMDRPAIASLVPGSATVQSIVTPLTANPNVNLTYDTNTAIQLLTEAGYHDGFPVNLYVSSNFSTISGVIPNDVVNAVKSCLGAVGINATITVLDPATFTYRYLIAHDMGFFLAPIGVWWAHPEFSTLGALFQNTPLNATHYSNSTFDSQFGSGAYTDAENTGFSTTDGLPIVPLYWSVNPPAGNQVSVITQAATDITTGSATLTGNLTTLIGYSSANVSFRWGTISGSLNQTTVNQSLTSPGGFNAPLSGLLPDTTYYYRAVASAGGQTVYGNELNFTSAAIPPPAEWTVPMTAVTATEGSNTNLAFGVNATATDGYDSNLDIPHPPPSPGVTLSAYFQIVDDLFPQLDKDYRAPASSVQWTLQVSSTSEAINLTWNASSIPSELSAYMNTGIGTVNMKTTNSTVLSSGAHTVQITVSSEVQVEIPLKAGWNMVSIPVTPADASVGSVFPDAQVVYAWNPATKSYSVVTDVEAGHGYWVAVVTDVTATVTGIPVNTWTVTSITAGWNMIGSIITSTSFASPNDNPDGSVSAFVYWWDPVSKSYVYGNTIDPGRGYWVAATQNCALTLPALP